MFRLFCLYFSTHSEGFGMSKRSDIYTGDMKGKKMGQDICNGAGGMGELGRRKYMRTDS